jgi:hypothetical protein
VVDAKFALRSDSYRRRGDHVDVVVIAGGMVDAVQEGGRRAGDHRGAW